MAALLIGGAIEGIDKLKKKRAEKRASTANATLESSSSSTPQHPPPSFSSTEVNMECQDDAQVASAIAEKERLRLEDEDAAEYTYHDIPEEREAPPPYQAPPYERHRSDILLESSQRHKRESHRPRALFPRRTNSDAVAESSAAAAQAERQGRTPCRIGRDGRCECGKRERSPDAPLGETVKERRDRKWKQMWNVNNSNFWGLVGVGIAR